jgi:hypothetical protein
MSALNDAQKKLAAIEALQKAAVLSKAQQQQTQAQNSQLSEAEILARRQAARALMKQQHAAEDEAKKAEKEKIRAEKERKKLAWQSVLADKAATEAQRAHAEAQLRDAKLAEIDSASNASDIAREGMSQFSEAEIAQRDAERARLAEADERENAARRALEIEQQAHDQRAVAPHLSTNGDVAESATPEPPRQIVSTPPAVTTPPKASAPVEKKSSPVVSVAAPVAAVEHHHAAAPAHKSRNANLKLLRQLADDDGDEDVKISDLRERERAERDKKLNDLTQLNAKLKAKEESHASSNNN